MGIFDKIKDNLDNGGVRVAVEVPGSFMQTDKNFQATVTISNKSKKERRVNKVVTKFVETYREANTRDKGGVPRSNVLHEQELSESFDLQAGENKTIFVVVPLSAQSATDNKALGAVADFAKMAFGAIDKREYYVEVKADVDGIANDPNDRERVQLV